MKARRESDEAVLADRLVNYSDALVAVAFLGVSGFGLAVADPDIRCTIAGATSPIILANLVNALLISGLIVLLRRWENDLRSESPQKGRVARYSRWLHVARIGVVWISLVFSVALAMASRGGTCAEPSAQATRRISDHVFDVAGKSSRGPLAAGRPGDPVSA